MKTIYLAVCAALLMILVSVALAADQPNFSGNYSLKAHSGPADGAAIEVVQTADSVEITTIDNGKRTTNHYLLNGSDVSCSDALNFSGKCNARVKGKQLILEWNITNAARQGSPLSHMHRKEFWQLSTDLKLLKVRTHTDFPERPNSFTSPGWADYVRVDKP